MANENKQQQPRSSMLRRLAGIVQSNSDDLYRSTYYSEPSNRQ